MANNHVYGFRFFRSLSGSDTPQHFTLPIASGYAPNTGADGSGGTSVNLNIGDPVQFIDGGTVRLVQPGQATTTAVLDDATFGIVVNFPRVKIDGAVRPNSFLTSGTTYTGGIDGQEATLVTVVPVAGNIFEIDCGAAPGASFDTAAEWAAAVGKQAHFTYSVLSSGVRGAPKANPVLDMSSINSTTGIRQLRIVGMSKLGDVQDFDGASVRMQVMFNAVQLSGYTPQTADIET
jgi:hypothetical protein